MRRTGLQLAAGVIGIGAGAFTLVIGLLMLLFGGVLGAIDTTSGSLAGSGALAMLFALVAIVVSAGFFVTPWGRPLALVLAVVMALVWWAFARVGAGGVAIVVVLPFCAAVLCGLLSRSGEGRPEANRGHAPR